MKTQVIYIPPLPNENGIQDGNGDVQRSPLQVWLRRTEIRDAINLNRSQWIALSTKKIRVKLLTSSGSYVYSEAVLIENADSIIIPHLAAEPGNWAEIRAAGHHIIFRSEQSVSDAAFLDAAPNAQITAVEPDERNGAMAVDLERDGGHVQSPSGRRVMGRLG